jgi:hypothetical protein
MCGTVIKRIYYTQCQKSPDTAHPGFFGAQMVKMEHMIMLVIKKFRVTIRVIIDSKKVFWGVVSGLPNSFFFKHRGLSSSGFFTIRAWSCYCTIWVFQLTAPNFNYPCPPFTPEQVTLFSLFEQMISFQV